MKIFLAEDDSGIIEVMSIILTQYQHQVVSIKNIDTIMSEIMQFLPDLIFLDISLFGKDGRAIAKQIRGKKELAQTPLILLSANSEIVDVAKQVGADDFLAKPFNLDDLLEKIKKYSPQSAI